jgi:transcriptional regulator with XRE-family HTH domain
MVKDRLMLPVQSKMARAALGLRVRDLAELADVSTDTITRLERGEPLRGQTVETVRAVLEAAGIVFIPEGDGGAGVRLKFSRRETAAIDNLENEGGIVGEDDA